MELHLALRLSQPVNFVARTNSLKFHYFRSNMFPSSVYTNINRIADNTLFEITDTDSNGFNLSVSQNSKSRIFNPVSPISLKLHLHKDTSESSIFEALEKVVERVLNLGGRCSQIHLSCSPQLFSAYGSFGFVNNDVNTMTLDVDLLLKHCKRRLSDNSANHMLSTLYTLIGRISHERSEWDNAIQNYTLALQQNPQSSPLFRNIGSVYHAKQQYQLAFASYQQAIELDKHDSSPYLKLAYLYEDLAVKDWLEASANARKCYEYYLESVNNDDLAALIRFGNFLVREHDTENAIKIYNKALAINETSSSVWFNLAYAQIKLAMFDEGKTSLQNVIELDSNNLAAIHMLTALDEKKNVDAVTMNENYIKQLFANYAQDYDEHLRKMRYSVPRLVRQEISKKFGFEAAEDHSVNLNTCAQHAQNECDDHKPQYNASLNILDLGCGTGLIGIFLKDFSKKIVGVDISAEMIEVCRNKRVYSKLVVNSVQDFLSNAPVDDTFDVVIAAELFSYIGELRQIISSVEKFMKKGSYFIFTVEEISSELCLPGREFKLSKSGRFGFNKAYVNSIVDNVGEFVTQSCKPIVTRYELGESVQGLLYILQKL